MSYIIRFEFEGQAYEVSEKGYELNRIVLPDGRVLEPKNLFWILFR